MNKKRLISSLLTIALCLSMIAGSTFALFTSKDTIDVSVKAAKVNITANVENIALSSMGIASADGKTFANGGTAEFDEENGVFTLTNIAPGDKVNFDIKITNNSNITIQYRVKWAVYGELLGALEAKLGDTEIANGVSEWTPWTTAEANTKTLNLSLELPTEAGDEYQEKTAKVAFLVEAVQGNGKDLYTSEINSVDALANALISGGEVVLSQDLDLGDRTLLVPAGTTVTLDLNGHTLSSDIVGAPAILNKGTLTIVDSASGVATMALRRVVIGGGIYNATSNAVKNDGGELTINGGTYSSGTSYAINNTNGKATIIEATVDSRGGVYTYNGTLTINGGSYYANATWQEGVNNGGHHTIYTNNSKVVINGGTFDTTVNGATNGAIMVGPDADVTVNAGNFITAAGTPDLTSTYIFTYENGGKLTVNDGDFNGGWRVNKQSTTKVNGGNFNIKITEYASENPELNIVGGVFNIDVSEWIDDTKHDVVTDTNGSYHVVNNGAEFIADGVLYDEANSEYQILNKDGLLWFAAEVNQYSNYQYPFQGETVKLMNDIDLDGMEWIPIGDYRFSANRFCGTFDGQDNTISNFQITKKTDKNDSDKSAYGFFGNLEGTVKNLTIENVGISGAPKFIGVLAGRFTSGLIENCKVTNSNVSCNNWTIGGLVGQWNDGKISGCTVENTTVTGYAGVGAIAGLALNAGERTLENCSVIGCTIAQNGSFGGDYDKMFGTVLGAAYNGELTVNLNGCKVENTTVLDRESTALFGYAAEGDVVKINGGKAYNVYTADELAALNAMMADKTAGRDAVVTLMSDIDFTGKTWTPVDSHADTAFTLSEINGNGYTLSNLTINGQAMFKRFAGSGDVVIKDITFDNATVNSTAINTSILTVQSYQNVLLDNVDVKNSTISGGYKVAPLIATVYNESSSTVTATLKNCDVSNTTVKATSYDFCTTGMVAFVYADDNDKIEFENCTVSDVTIIAPDDSYDAHAWIYTTGSGTLFNEADGVTVTNCTFEVLN